MSVARNTGSLPWGLGRSRSGLAGFLIVTGFALYAEGLGQGSWADKLFGWAIPLLGGSHNTRMWHLTAMWLILVFAIIHIYMAIRADIMSRESSISTIIGGWRMYKDDLP